MPGAGLVCAGLAVALSVALPGCDRVTPAPLAGPGYPSLRDVPPRPEPADTIGQREEIGAGLIRDRGDARYTNQAIRYRTGLAEVPPLPVVVAPEPPPPVAVTPEAVPVRPAGPTVLDDDDGLDDLLRRLVDQAETVAPFESPNPAPAEPPNPAPEEAPAATPAEPAAGPEAADGALPPLALFPTRTEAEEDPGAGLLAWMGRRLRALAGAPGPEPARPLHPALVPVSVTGPEDLGQLRVTAPDRGATPAVMGPPVPAVPALKPAIQPPAPAVPALKPAAGADGAAARTVSA